MDGIELGLSKFHLSSCLSHNLWRPSRSDDMRRSTVNRPGVRIADAREVRRRNAGAFVGSAHWPSQSSTGESDESYQYVGRQLLLELPLDAHLGPHEALRFRVPVGLRRL